MSQKSLCPGCGAELDDETLTCSKCGFKPKAEPKFNYTNIKSIRKKQRKRSARIAALFGAIIVVIYIIITIGISFSGIQHQNPYTFLTLLTIGFFLVPGFLVVIPLLTWLITFIKRKYDPGFFSGSNFKMIIAAFICSLILIYIGCIILHTLRGKILFSIGILILATSIAFFNYRIIKIMKTKTTLKNDKEQKNIRTIESTIAEVDILDKEKTIE